MNAMELKTVDLKNGSSWKDLVGIVASVGCAIHCAAMPFVIAYLPAWGLSFLADEAFHKWMALICFLIALAAFFPGLRKHGSWVPVGIGSAGLVLITFAAFGLAGECCPSCEAVANANADVGADSDLCGTTCEHCEPCSSETSSEQIKAASLEVIDSTSEDKDLLSRLAPWITPLGGMLLVAAHLMNRHFGGLCNCCGPEAELLPDSTS